MDRGKAFFRAAMERARAVRPTFPGQSHSNMRIRVVRHGKPAYRYPARGGWCTANVFNDALDAYDRAGLDPAWNRTRRPELAADRLFSSDLPRALETAVLCTGAAPDHMQVSPVFREVPLPRWRPGRLKLPLFVWMAGSRLAWQFGWLGGAEPKQQSLQRVVRAADLLEEAGRETGDVLLFAHGFFLFLLGRELGRRGWKTKKKGLYRYLEVGEFRREG